MAKWDFKIVGASFVKELVPVDGDVDFRSQSFMQPSFDLEGDKIVMKESGQYKTSIGFSQIGEIAGVAPTDLQDAYDKLLALVENFNGGGATSQTLQQVLEGGNTGVDIGIVLTSLGNSDSSSLNHNQLNVTDGDYLGTLKKNVLSFLDNIQNYVTNFSPTGFSFIKNNTESTNVSFENPTALNSVIIPNKSGTIAMLSDVVGSTWGSITGTLSAQTDLQTALDAKQDDLTAANMHIYVDGLTALTTPVDADRMIIVDNSASLAKKITWANIKATLKTYFDTLYQPITTATTGSVIAFANPQIYNSIASPSSSNITDSLTGARIGVVQKIYHNAGTAPTFPAGWVRRGTGTYVTSTLNIIYAEWSVGTTVEYWITQ